MIYDDADDLVAAYRAGDRMPANERAIAKEIVRLQDRVSELEQQAVHPAVNRVAAALDHAKEGV